MVLSKAVAEGLKLKGFSPVNGGKGPLERGRVQKGYFADIVVFDPQRVIDTATFDDPKQYPLGIPYVLVNGQVAVDPQGCTGALAGQAVPAA